MPVIWPLWLIFGKSIDANSCLFESLKLSDTINKVGIHRFEMLGECFVYLLVWGGGCQLERKCISLLICNLKICIIGFLKKVGLKRGVKSDFPVQSESVTPESYHRTLKDLCTLQQCIHVPFSLVVPNHPPLARQMRELAASLLSAPVECATTAWLKKEGLTAEAGRTKEGPSAPTKCQEIVWRKNVHLTHRGCCRKSVRHLFNDYNTLFLMAALKLMVVRTVFTMK